MTVKADETCGIVRCDTPATRPLVVNAVIRRRLTTQPHDAPKMFEPAVPLAALFSAGLGMALVGAVNVFAGRAAWVRAVGTGVGCAAGAGGAGALSADAETAAGVALGVAAAALLPLLTGSARVAAAAGAAARAARVPAVRWGGFAAAGVAIAFGAVADFERRDDALLDQSAADLEALAAPPSRAPAGARAVTDGGSAVALMEAVDPRPVAQVEEYEAALLRGDQVRHRVIRQHPADDRTNCHGWVFAGGRFWVPGAAVDQILVENGYRPVSDPQPGDLIVYRGAGAVAHTAVVRYVAAGRPVMVEGKWGCAGVYLHAAEDSPYGAAFAYHRSSRPGHLLAGLGGPSPDEPAAAAK